jgi:hypothetical protein
MSDDALQQELLRLDILLRRKQVFWETPKGLLLIIAAAAAIAGFLGFRIGAIPPPPPAPIVIHLEGSAK